MVGLQTAYTLWSSCRTRSGPLPYLHTVAPSFAAPERVLETAFGAFKLFPFSDCTNVYRWRAGLGTCLRP